MSRWVLSLNKNTDPREFASHILIIAETDPHVAEAIRKRIANSVHPALRSLAQQLHFPLLRHQPIRNDLEITIQVPGGSVTAQKSLLCQNSPYFDKLLNGAFSERQQNVVQISEQMDGDQNLGLLGVEDFKAFNDYIAILQGKSIQLNSKKIVAIGEIAERFLDEKVLPGLARYAVANMHEFTEQELYSILSNYNKANALSRHIEKENTGKKLCLDNWEYYWEIARELNFVELREKCATYVRSQAIQLVSSATHTGPRLREYIQFSWQTFDVAARATFQETLANNLHINNLSTIWEFAVENDLEPLKQLAPLKQAVLRFCERESQLIRQNLPWNLPEVPPAIGRILYPRAINV